ncbi:hypothetical protein SAMN05880590_11198 [Rhizobium sp. RU35A]|nr:hypothetical protein SAMN05880590_11198 [Rhizobium sp. RU35A]
MQSGDQAGDIAGVTAVNDCSITYGGRLPLGSADDAPVVAEVLRALTVEAERRGWSGARVVAVRRDGAYRQIEIVPADSWSLDLPDLTGREPGG